MAELCLNCLHCLFKCEEYEEQNISGLKNKTNPVDPKWAEVIKSYILQMLPAATNDTPAWHKCRVV